MKRPLASRRHFLRAASGLAVALPLLPSLRARGQTAEFPKRLVTMYTPNGQIHETWWPAELPGGAFTLNQAHAPLAPHQNRLTLLRGVDLQSAQGGPGGPHQRGIGTLFTGMQLLEGEFVDGCGSQAGWANGISVDQEVANLIGQDTPFKSLELGVRATENDVQGRISYAGAGLPLQPMLAPLEVYDRMFRNLVVTADPNAPPMEVLIAERRSVLDAVGEQIGELEKKVSNADKSRLDAHLTLVRDLERRLGSVIGHCAKPPEPQVLDPASEVDMPTIAELEIDLLSIAFACDLVRVASFEISTGLNRIRYPWLSSMGEGHPLSHMGSSDTDAVAQLTARAAWHSKLIARLFDNLAATAEGDATVADRTLLVWCSEVSEGNVHSHTSMPFLLMGGGWHFQTGRYLDAGSASHIDLLVTILNAMGVEKTTFGMPEFCTGPLRILT
ncbi:MAG TPA: DUF1552 domain-containing protein [Polyangiaceae bacterium]